MPGGFCSRCFSVTIRLMKLKAMPDGKNHNTINIIILMLILSVTALVPLDIAAAAAAGFVLSIEMHILADMVVSDLT